MRYGRSEGGIATGFFSNKLPTYFLSPILVPVFLSCWLGYSAILFNGLFVFMGLILLLYFKRKMGCITGDMLGAMGEVLEAWLFLLACISPQNIY
jgi:adenosylcobinamide-GDP ribazoletransferase